MKKIFLLLYVHAVCLSLLLFFFDVGAFIGYHSMRMARLTPNHNVYVFEGRLNLHDIIKQNIQRNNINNIQLIINDIRLDLVYMYDKY